MFRPKTEANLAAFSRAQSQLAATHLIAALVAAMSDDVEPHSAVALFPGLNVEQRIRTAVRTALRQNPKATLISTGTNDQERRRDGDCDERRIVTLVPEAEHLDIRADPEGPFVPIQVDNALDILGFLPKGRGAFRYDQRNISARPPCSDPIMGVRSVAFIACAWHLPRVLLTWARRVLRGIEQGTVAPEAALLKIWPVAAPCRLTGDLGAVTPAHIETGYDDVVAAAVSETLRLENYKEDVGDFKDLVTLLRRSGQIGE